MGVAGYWVEPHPTKPRPPGPSEPGGTKTFEEEKKNVITIFFILQILLSVLK